MKFNNITAGISFRCRSYTINWDSLCVFNAILFALDQQNLALGKLTWQSSTKSPLMTSDKAVDGKKGLHSSVGGCSATADNSQSATWWVNLGRISSINYVVIYFRTDDKIWGLSMWNIQFLTENLQFNSE